MAETERMERCKPIYTQMEASEVTPTAGDALGCRIAVFWSSDDAWFEGHVRSFNAVDGKHLVQFDDGDSEWYLLSDEQVRWYRQEAALETVPGA